MMPISSEMDSQNQNNNDEDDNDVKSVEELGKSFDSQEKEKFLDNLLNFRDKLGENEESPIQILKSKSSSSSSS